MTKEFNESELMEIKKFIQDYDRGSQIARLEPFIIMLKKIDDAILEYERVTHTKNNLSQLTESEFSTAREIARKAILENLQE